MEVPDIKLYREEKKKWIEANEPVRTDEKVLELYNICADCENYTPLPLFKDRGQCKICTCLLSKDGDRMNKLRWATTKCPLEEPKWLEEEEYRQEKSEPEPKQIGPDPHRGRNKGCGCG